MMRILRYTILHIRRRPQQFLCSFAAVTLLGCLLLSVDASMRVRQQALDATVDHSEVWCHVQRSSGTSQWAASAYHVAQLVHPSDPAFAPFVQAYVTDVRARVTLDVQPAGMPAEIEAVFLTCWEADNTLLLMDERRLTFAAGYGTDILTGDEAICIAGSQVAAIGDFLTFTLPENCGGTEIIVRVVGVIADDNRAYLPWALYESHIGNLHAATPADSLSFRLKDNRLMGEFQQAAADFYTPGGTDAIPEHEHTLTIRDTQFRENLTAANRNLAIMGYLQPVFLLLSLGVGVLLAAMLLRGRQREYAILRSLGQSSGFILLQSAAETLLAVLSGIVLVLLVMQSDDKTKLLPLLCAILLGCLLPTLRYVTRPVLHQVKGES